MIRNIEKCSVQFVNSLLQDLTKTNPQHIFWIRDETVTRQIYMSDNFSSYWKYDAQIMYDMPFLWVTTLAQDNINSYMQQLQQRHETDYLDSSLNSIHYQITTGDGQNICLRDKTFKLKSSLGIKYVAGVSKSIPTELWHPSFEKRSNQWDDSDQRIHRQFLALLHKHFGLALVALSLGKKITLQALQEDFCEKFHQKLTRRELECLYYLCQGDTTKQTAKQLNLSTRTIETYLENLRSKTELPNKLSLISTYSGYFNELSELEIKDP